jgi:hypothetical protein
MDFPFFSFPLIMHNTRNAERARLISIKHTRLTEMLYSSSHALVLSRFSLYPDTRIVKKVKHGLEIRYCEGYSRCSSVKETLLSSLFPLLCMVPYMPKHTCFTVIIA